MRFGQLLLCVLIISLRMEGRASARPPEDVTAAKQELGPPVSRVSIGHPVHPYPLASNVVEATNASSRLVMEVHESNATLRVSLADGEALWGFGERFDSLNMRGRTMETWIVDAWGGGNRSYICAPFFISSAGYGLFVNCAGNVKFDSGATTTNELRIEVPEDGLDVFLFRGTPREILAEYTKLVGRPQAVPDWVFEPWISRNSYLSEYDIDHVIDKMEAHGLKASAVVLEAWAESLQNFRFEQGRYPKPKEWITKLHERGYHVVCWETPSLWDSASTYLDAKTNDFLVLKPDGSELRVDWLENAVKIDFRKESARKWWQKLHEPLIALGVDGFKTDGGERMPDPWFHNLHPYYYQSAVLDAFQAQGKVGMTFARSGTAPCAGDAAFWGGDQSSSWNDFPRVVRAGLSAALSGFPYWGHDIGGYSGTPTKNLYIRWLELGAFSPIMQLHGTTAREPWYYDDETVRIVKYYFDLRWALRDYILAAAKRAREDGVPMWRPLLYEFPDDPATYNTDDEFFLGDDLLVAPVLTEFGERKIYLPHGEWVDVWTKEKITGPKTFTVQPKLAEIPAFVRADRVAKFEKMFPPVPVDPRGDITIELAGATNERGIVPTTRLIRGEKYAKVFVTVHNRGTVEASGDVRVNLPDGFTALPNAVQPYHVKAQGEARLAFYAILPKELAVGTYLVGINSMASGALALQFVEAPHWQVMGPFDGGVGAKFADELPTNSAAEYLGAGGKKVRWKAVADDCVRDDGFVDFEKALGKDNNGATTFGATTFASSNGGAAKLYFGSGDALTIWLNGRQVFDKQVHRSAEPDEDAVDVTLRAGENSVLVKTSRGIGPNGIYFRVSAGSS
jgi:alpha-glucosidase (family GH31 glycosyl hydrolase)